MGKSSFLYRIITKYGYRFEYRYEEAMEIFEKEGLRIYAYTKDLKPTTILLRWK